MVNASEQAHVEAVLALLNTALPGAWKAWDLDELDPLAAKPAERIEVTVTRRYIQVGRVSTDQDIDGWRIQTRVVADIIANARELRRHVRARLEKAVLTVGTVTTTPIRYETGDDIARDDQRFWSGYETWTYTH